MTTAAGARMSPRRREPIATALLLGAAAFTIQLLWVRRFAVSVPFWDEWTGMYAFLAQYQSGAVGWRELFAQHMEHRIPVARIAFILVQEVFGEGSLLACLVISAALMGAIAGVWVYTLRRLGDPIWLAVTGVLVLLSISQFENMLWGFQVEFYTLVLPVVAAVCWIARAPRLSWAGVIGCAAACAISSYSIASGLTSWASVGLTLLLRTWAETRSIRALASARREWRLMAAFVGIGLAVSAAYLHDYQRLPASGGPGRSLVDLLHWSAAAFVFPIVDPLAPAGVAWLPLVVLVVTVPILLAIRVCWRARDTAHLVLIVGVLLMVIGNVGIMAFGRSAVGFVASRYGTICLWGSVTALTSLAVLLRHARRPATARWSAPVVVAVILAIAGAHVWRYVTFLPLLREYHRVRLVFEHNLQSYLSDASPARQLPAVVPFPPGPVAPLLQDARFLAVLPSNLRPRVRVRAGGAAWTYGGVPAAVPRLVEHFTWGSWSGDAARTGTLTSSPFRVRDALVLKIVGQPRGAGSSLAVESVSDPARRVVYTGPDPGERWIEWRLDGAQVPASRVRIVAMDGSHESGGWFGVAAPYEQSAAVRRLEFFVARVELWMTTVLFVLAAWVGLSARGKTSRFALENPGGK